MKVKVNYVGKIEGLVFEDVKRFKVDKDEKNAFKRIRIERKNGQVHLIAEKYVSGFEITDDKRKKNASECWITSVNTVSSARMTARELRDARSAIRCFLMKSKQS